VFLRVDQRDNEDQQETRLPTILVDQRPPVAARGKYPAGKRGEDRVGRERLAAALRCPRDEVELVDRVDVDEPHQRGADERGRVSGPPSRAGDLHPGELGARTANARVTAGLMWAPLTAAGHPRPPWRRPSPSPQVISSPVAGRQEDRRPGVAARPGPPAGRPRPWRPRRSAEGDQGRTSPKKLGEQFAPKLPVITFPNGCAPSPRKGVISAIAILSSRAGLSACAAWPQTYDRPALPTMASHE